MAEMELPRRIEGPGRTRAAKAPTAENVGQVRIARDPGVRVPSGAFGEQIGAGAAQAAQGLQDFGASLAGASSRLVQARRKAAVASATSRATADMRAFVLDLQQDTDVDTYGPRFQERAEKAFETYSQGLDAEGQAAFRADFEKLSLEQAYQVRKLANGKLVDGAIADLDGNLDRFARLAASAGTSEEYEELVIQATRAIEEAQINGIISAEDAGNRRLAFASHLDEVTAMQEMSRDPEMAAEMLTDPEMFPNLDPKRRQSMLDSAISKADIAQRRRNAEADRQERLADKRMNEEGEELLKETYALIDSGAEPTPDQLDELKNHPGVSPSEYKGLLKSLEQDGTTEDDPVAIAWLQTRLHDEDISQDLTRALDEGQITPETYRSMYNKNQSAISDNRPASPYKSGRSFVNTALDPGQIGGDPTTQQPFRIAQQNALADYDTWFEANPDATRAQAMEQARTIMQQYQVVAFDQMRFALPRPRGYSGSKQGVTLEAVEAARDALADDIRNERVSDDQAALEIQQLNNWEHVLSGGVK